MFHLYGGVAGASGGRQGGFHCLFAFGGGVGGGRGGDVVLMVVVVVAVAGFLSYPVERRGRRVKIGIVG